MAWGFNCNMTCNCCGNVLSCDPLEGCVDCVTGFEGYNCENDVDECANSSLCKCTTNSHCENTDGSYACFCDPWG